MTVWIKNKTAKYLRKMGYTFIQQICHLDDIPNDTRQVRQCDWPTAPMATTWQVSIKTSPLKSHLKKSGFRANAPVTLLLAIRCTWWSLQEMKCFEQSKRGRL